MFRLRIELMSAPLRQWHHRRIVCHPAIKNDFRAILEPTEWQRIGDQINAAFIFARADFVKVLRASHSCRAIGSLQRLVRPSRTYMFEVDNSRRGRNQEKCAKGGELTCQ